MSKPSLEMALHLLATGLLEAIDAKERGKERWLTNSPSSWRMGNLHD
ncbi:hypothetical protein [Nostoc sp. 'Peltigera malacea cyanobiont' DB3992]|nr:hypothetical protein [Nostoc sp. 'Peltigera malacea cyanobiont' DB3992]